MAKAEWRTWAMGLLGRLGIRPLLWRIYCRILGPGGGVAELKLGPLRARFYVHSEWIAHEIKSYGGEEEVLSRFIGLLRPEDVVFDVGANLGLYSIFMGQQVGPRGQVIAFEPEPHYCERLKGNAALNALRNLHIHCLALGDHSYSAELLPSQRGTAAPRLVGSAENSDARSTKVKVVEGDRLTKDEKLPVPRAIKIDVEGHEHAVLRGLAGTLSNPACRIVCCEIHPALLPHGVGLPEIQSLLESSGFAKFEVFSRPPEKHLFAYKGE